MAKVGRNAPCPCGSGRKYKRCCLPDEQALNRLYPLLIDLTEEMTHFAEQRYGERIVDQAWLDFWEEEPPEHWEESELFDLFIGWFSFHWIPEDHRESETDILPCPGTLAAQVLESGWKLEPASRQLLAAARQEPLAFWEIESTDGQGRAGLRDLVLGRRLEVWLPPPYQWIEADDMVLAQAIPAGGTHILGALSPPLAGNLFGDPLRKGGADLRENYRLRSPRDLLPYDLNFLHLYQRLVEALLEPPLTNTDGEQVAFTWSAYTFEPARRPELMGLLRSMRNFQYLGDPLDPLGSGEDGEQLALDLGLARPLRLFQEAEGDEEEEEEEEEEEDDDDDESAEQKLLPFPGLARGEDREEEDDRLPLSEEIERWLDPEGRPATARPTFLWRLRRSRAALPETTMARIYVLEVGVVTVTNSAPRDGKLRRRLQRNAGHILTYVDSMEQPFWKMAGVFADDE